MSARSARDIAAQSPGRETWRRLIAALDELPADAVQEALPDLGESLASWPDRIRVRPRRWGIDVRSSGAQLRETPHAGWPLGRALHLGAIANAEIATALAAWPHLAGVSVLTLEGSRPGEALADLLSADNLAGLHTLGLRRAGLWDAGSAWLGSPALEGLRRLDLAGAELPDEALEALGRTPLPRLDRLHLGNAKRPRRPLVQLFRDADWPRLRRLNLHGSRFDEKLALAIARNASLAGIERLTIGTLDRSEPLDVGAIDALVEGGRQPALERLTVRGMRLDERTAEALLRSARGIRELVVRDCELPARIRERWRRGHVDGPNVRVR